VNLRRSLVRYLLMLKKRVPSSACIMGYARFICSRSLAVMNMFVHTPLIIYIHAAWSQTHALENLYFSGGAREESERSSLF